MNTYIKDSQNYCSTEKIDDFSPKKWRNALNFYLKGGELRNQ
jgi:hypothetical protein